MVEGISFVLVPLKVTLEIMGVTRKLKSVFLDWPFKKQSLENRKFV